MGLLDDAIREHLELKRRRGADPGEVAREEHEALNPTLGAPVDRPGPAGGAAPPTDDDPAGSQAPGPGEELQGEQGEHELGAPAGEQAAAQQETAELDMQRVLEQDGGAPAEHFASPGRAGDDWFGRDPAGQHGDVPGQESFPFE